VVAGGVRGNRIESELRGSCYVALVLPFMDTVSGFGPAGSAGSFSQQMGTFSQKGKADRRRKPREGTVGLVTLIWRALW